MKRRELAFLLAGAATTWPLAAVAQPRVPRIGALFGVDPEPAWRMFRDGLKALGYVDGQSIRLELRSANGQIDRLPGLAAELVRLPVDLIVAFQTPSVQAAKAATSEIPIVMASAGDPVATGLIASLARPGGNITGMSGTTAELGAKTLELIREALPHVRRVAVLANAADPFTTTFLDQIGRAAGTMGIVLQRHMVRGTAEFGAAFAAMHSERADAVIVQPSLPRQAAAELALKQRLPAISPTSTFAGEGGLMSYAANLAVQYREAAVYVDKILKGRKPADLPVGQPTKFDLVINLRTAKAVGLTLPASLIERADEVIE